MAPKIAAAASFVAATGGRAVIGALADAEAMLDGHAGTAIVRDAGEA
jgi:carbamate kinase